MAIYYQGTKLTPNQVAKYMLIDAMELKYDFWEEQHESDFYKYNGEEHKLSKKDRKQIKEQLNKRLNGLLRYLGANYYYKQERTTK